MSQNWGQMMDERISKLEDRMNKAETRIAVAESSLKDVKEDISSIKDDTKWLRRTITGAIITTVIGVVLGGMVALVLNF